MRLTADLLARSPAYTNPIKDRELDLRGAQPKPRAALSQPSQTPAVAHRALMQSAPLRVACAALLVQGTKLP